MSNSIQHHPDVFSQYTLPQTGLSPRDAVRLATLAPSPSRQSSIRRGTSPGAVTAAEAGSAGALSRPLNPADHQALHQLYVRKKLYNKHSNGHTHHHDYGMKGVTLDGKRAAPAYARILRDEIKRMDETGQTIAVTMPIPLHQANRSYVAPLLPDQIPGGGREPVFGASAPHAHSPASCGPSSCGGSKEEGKIHPRMEEQIREQDIALDIPAVGEEPSCCGVDHGRFNTVPTEHTYYGNAEAYQRGEDPRQAAELYYYSAIDSLVATAFKKLFPHERKRFKPMITAANISTDKAWEHAYNMLTQHKGVFFGFGETTIHKENVRDKVAGPPASLAGRGLEDWLRFAGQVGVSATVHCDIEEKADGAELSEKVKPLTDAERARLENGRAAQLAQPTYIENIKAAFRRHPHTTIIWAHTGLGRHVSPRPKTVDAEGKTTGGHIYELRKLCEDPTLKHVSMDISWDKVAKYLNEDPEMMQDMAALINDYPDRFIFGEDGLVTKDAATAGTTYRAYHDLRARLTPQVETMVFKDNLKRILERSEKNRDSWERAGCPELKEGHNGLYRGEGGDTDTSKIKTAWRDIRYPGRTGRILGQALKPSSLTTSHYGLKPSVDGKEEGTYKVKPAPRNELQQKTLGEICAEIRQQFIDKYGVEKFEEVQTAINLTDQITNLTNASLQTTNEILDFYKVKFIEQFGQDAFDELDREVLQPNRVKSLIRDSLKVDDHQFEKHLQAMYIKNYGEAAYNAVYEMRFGKARPKTEMTQPVLEAGDAPLAASSSAAGSSSVVGERETLTLGKLAEVREWLVNTASASTIS